MIVQPYNLIFRCLYAIDEKQKFADPPWQGFPLMIALFATFTDKNRNKRKSIPGPHPHVLPNRTTHQLRILQRYPAIFDFLPEFVSLEPLKSF